MQTLGTPELIAGPAAQKHTKTRAKSGQDSPGDASPKSGSHASFQLLLHNVQHAPGGVMCEGLHRGRVSPVVHQADGDHEFCGAGQHGVVEDAAGDVVDHVGTRGDGLPSNLGAVLRGLIVLLPSRWRAGNSRGVKSMQENNVCIIYVCIMYMCVEKVNGWVSHSEYVRTIIL